MKGKKNETRELIWEDKQRFRRIYLVKRNDSARVQLEIGSPSLILDLKIDLSEFLLDIAKDFNELTKKLI